MKVTREVWPKIHTMYLHSDKDSGYESGAMIGLEGQALSDFARALYEVAFELRVYEDGSYDIINVYET